MQKIFGYKLYSTSVVPVIFMLAILHARYYGGNALFHTIAEFFCILVGLMMFVIVSYTHQFTKNNFLLYLGIGYFWISILDFIHMLTYPGMLIFAQTPNYTLAFWIAARFLEASVLISAIFINFHTISKLKVFFLFGLSIILINIFLFSEYLPVLFEQGRGLTSLKINLEYTIIFILMTAILIYTIKKKNFDKSTYYYIVASIVLTICAELTLTFYAQVDDYFTVLAHLFKFLSYWMIFLSIIKTSLEKPFKYLAHESSTYNSIPFPSILVDAQGIIRQINDATSNFLNLKKDKIINQNNHILFHDQYTKEDECTVCQAIKEGKILLSHLLQKETSTYSFTINPISMKDLTLGSVQVCIDITKQKRTQILLEEKKNELETIIQEAPNPMIIFDEDGNIFKINQACINSTGFSLNETPTVDAWVECMYDDAETIISVKKHIYSLYEITKHSKATEFSFFNKKRDLVTWQCRSGPLGIIDGKRAFISSAMDITEIKHKDEMLINQSRQAAMGEMISMIAHQWRQPLNHLSAININIYMHSQQGTLTPKILKEKQDASSLQIKHMSDTIDDFMNFFSQKKQKNTFYLREIIDDVLRLMNASFSSNHINVEIIIAKDKNITTYKNELLHVLIIILTNAKDALKDKPIDNRRISIMANGSKIIVSDNAGGINQSIIKKVFEPYFSTKKNKHGAGIGLFTAKTIMNNNIKGNLTASNTKDGAVFTIALP